MFSYYSLRVMGALGVNLLGGQTNQVVAGDKNGRF